MPPLGPCHYLAGNRKDWGISRLAGVPSAQHLSSFRVYIQGGWFRQSQIEELSRRIGSVTSGLLFGKRETYENSQIHSLAGPGCNVCRFFCRGLSTIVDLGRLWAASAPGVRSTPLPATRLSLDARLLELWTSRIFLGSRNMGHGAAAWLVVDTRLLGLGRQRIPVSRWILGPDHRVLRWH